MRKFISPLMLHASCVSLSLMASVEAKQQSEDGGTIASSLSTELAVEWFACVEGDTHDAAARGPLRLAKGSRIAMVGGGLGSRMNHFGHFETELQIRYPELDLYIRNMCREGDTPLFRPHSSRKEHWVVPGTKELLKEEFQKNTASTGHYETPDEWLTRHKIDTIVGFFGYTESFEGVENVERFKKQLTAFITHTCGQRYNGESPQLAVVSSIAFEDLSDERDLPNGIEHNKRLAVYTEAMKQVCEELQVQFVDVFSPTAKWYRESEENLTQNGHNLTSDGYAKLAPYLADRLFGISETKGDRVKVHSAVMDKNKYWLNDYKIPNGVHVHGRRYKPFGPQNYPDELKKTREITAIRDRAIWAANRGEKIDVLDADSKTHPLSPVPSNRGKKPLTPYLGGKETEALITLADGYSIELFASEEEFPELANPMQLSFDNKGRLWVACMPSYPHYRIGDPAPKDKLLILEDTDNDGKADKQTIFADDLHLPIGFEFAPEGVYVSQGNDLVLLQDTDGDDRYDVKKVILSGFDDHDTHHAISAFCADPSGAIIMGEGLFTHTNVETPYGVVRGSNGGFYRYSPQRGRLERTAQYKIPNPWGIAYDDWGQNFFLKTSGTHFCWMQRTAIKSRYGVNPEAPNLLGSENVRPTSGLEFISSGHFPDAVQGDVLLCNNIGFLGAKQHQVEDEGTGYKVTFRQNLFQSENPRFRPVDLEFAPDGSLYVVDWSNALIGHMQHNARDPKRDHDHGRVYRITYKGRPLLTPAKVDGATIEELLENLKLHEYRTRYRSRRELRGRDQANVLSSTLKWVASLDKADPKYEHHLLEALYVTWGINQVDAGLVEQLLEAKNYKARAAAVRVVHFNPHRLTNQFELLLKAASDPHGRVRLEAITAATWLEREQGLKIIAEAKKHDVDAWMKEAVVYGEAHLQDRDAELKHIPVATPKFLNRAGKEIVDLYKKGHEIYKEGENCASCHGMKGEGLPAAGFPPLDDSKWVKEDKERLIKIVLNGLEGPLEVNGKKFNSIMPGFGPRMSDEEISAVLTYVRNAWSNRKRDIVSAAEVKKVRESLKGEPNMMKTHELLRDHPHAN